MPTRDSEAARDEDQTGQGGGGMGPRGGHGPTAASASDTEGAFGDAQGRRDHPNATVDGEGPRPFDGPAKE